MIGFLNDRSNSLKTEWMNEKTKWFKRDNLKQTDMHSPQATSDCW